MIALQLNREQQQAVDHFTGPLLILAGAGSGKTRVITQHIVSLIEKGVNPHNILAVTFTNKAAQEMKTRVQQETSKSVYIATFHSLGARILRESIAHLGYNPNFVIYDEEDSLKVLRACLKHFNVSDKQMTPKSIKYTLSKIKNDLLPIEELELDTSPIGKLLPDIYKRYQILLQQANAVDFDDLLYLPVKLFKEHPDVCEYYQNTWPYLLIDEYQDINKAQYLLSSFIAKKSQNIFVVGDPDQSIYAWRGANISNILNFKRDWLHATVIKLEQNYRSTTTILNAANALIQNNASRYEKNLWSDLGKGDPIKCYQAQNEHDEADFVVNNIQRFVKQGISYNNIAILYRTNAQSRSLEDSLLKMHLPYVVVGGISFYHRKEIKDVLAWLRMVHTGQDFISLQRTINLPKRGIGEATLAKIQEGAREASRDLFDFCRDLVYDEASSMRLSKKQRDEMQGYVEIISQLRRYAQTASIHDLINETLQLTRYLQYLDLEPDTAEDRKSNVSELAAKAFDWEEENENPSLESFLEELSLKTTLDETEHQKERISLMTMHNGKGLEFDLVFLVGLEEMLFPHINSLDSEAEIEEERRLCYVGMTRAKKNLYISYAKSRFLWGSLKMLRKSRFLDEIPAEYRENVGKPHMTIAPIPTPQPEQTISSFKEGELVYHKEFGIGKIRSIGSCSLGTTYDILFQKSNTQKTLVAKFAQLSKLN